MLVSPQVPLPKLTKTLKTFTARRANQLLGRAGNAFWQEENYDRLVRDHREFDRIHSYIENNPVRAQLVSDPTDYRWSSARADRQVASDPDLRPTIS